MVVYEFVVEELDYYAGCGDDPDIVDTHAMETLEEAKKFAAGCELPWRIVLVRDQGNDTEGLIDRSWAYPVDGKLPERFSYGMGEMGMPVPARFRKLVFP